MEYCKKAKNADHFDLRFLKFFLNKEPIMELQV